MTLSKPVPVDTDYAISGKPSEVPLTDALCPETQAALTYWRSLSHDRAMPGWRDVNLLEFSPTVIPRIMVVDVHRNPLDFVYRFFGTWQAACHQKDMSGLSVNAYKDEPYRLEIFKEYSVVTERAEPVLYHLELYLKNITYRSEILRLPLSNDGSQVDGILVVETLIPMAPKRP